MEQLDNYLFNYKNNYIIGFDILQKYKDFQYEDMDDMELDLELLLSVKYKNIKLYETEEDINIDDNEFELKKVRQEQEQFRKKLLERYKKCIITETSCIDELEGAHIKPYACNGKTNIDNGLLLSRNIHSTFDKYLWSINPETLIIECKENENVGTIEKYKNQKVNIQINNKLKRNLQYHYNKFKKV